MKSTAPTPPIAAAAVSAVALLFVSCGDNERSKRTADQLDAVIELLEHDDSGLKVAESVRVESLKQSFKLGGTRLQVLEHWPLTETVRETRNDNPEPAHAVEVQWDTPDDDGEESLNTEWVFPTAENGPSGVLLGLDLQARVLPPGALLATTDAWENAPRETVQFGRDDQFFPVPEIGAEALPGWTVKGIRSFERALFDDGGELQESDDDGFTNRALEVTIESSDDGTVERHVCFIDHPKLTKGIHPALLPVTRLAGSSASNSRLAARDPIAIPNASSDRLLLSPSTYESGKLTAFTWERESDKVATHEIGSLPADVKVGSTTLRLLKHYKNASSVLKWHKVEKPAEGGAETTPALLISWQNGHHPQKTVLPLDRPTPVRIGSEFSILRYREAGE